MAAIAALLSTTADGRWQPSIGDPTLMGWLTVVAYFAAAWLALRSARAAARELALEPERAALTRFWLVLALLLFALGINKQLDLQTLLTQLARDLAVAQGWYTERRRIQVLFIVGIGFATLFGTIGLAYALRRIVARVWLALCGVGFLLGFIVIRAASFHHVDLLLRSGPVRLNWLFELGGIGLIAFAAFREGAPASAEPPLSSGVESGGAER